MKKRISLREVNMNAVKRSRMVVQLLELKKELGLFSKKIEEVKNTKSYYQNSTKGSVKIGGFFDNILVERSKDYTKYQELCKLKELERYEDVKHNKIMPKNQCNIKHRSISIKDTENKREGIDKIKSLLFRKIKKYKVDTREIGDVSNYFPKIRLMMLNIKN